MVAEQRCLWISTERVDSQKVGEQPGELWVEEQNAVIPQMVEQCLEVPKILPQDRVLQTAKQIADHLDKRVLAGTEKMRFSGSQLEGLGNRRAVGRVITAENDEKQLKLMVDECAEKVVGEL